MRLREFFDQPTDEMIGVKKYHDMDADQATYAIAKDMGTEVLGPGGAFGKVIQSSNPEIVYKVFEKDDAYLNFIRFVQQNPNKHFPKFYKVKNMTAFFKRYDVQSDKFYVVALEKLYPVKKGPFKSEFLSDLLGTPSLNHSTHLLPNGKENEAMIPAREFVQHIRELKDLWQAGLKVRGLHKDSFDYNWDLHPGNIMQRADGTIVITDPLSSNEAFDYKEKVYDAKKRKDQMVKGPKYSQTKAEPAPTPTPQDDREAIRVLIKQAKAKVAELKDRIDRGEQLSPMDQRMHGALQNFIHHQEPKVGRVTS